MVAVLLLFRPLTHPMPSSTSLIAEDLRGLIVGDVLSNDVSRRIYASDASLYEILPAAIVRPRMTADVVATVLYASERGLPVHARGAGSGLAGGALGEGIVLDFSRYMRRFLSDEGETVSVQPGLVHAVLNRRLAAGGPAQGGRLFAPDPAMSEVTTLGSVASIDSGGSRRPAYGSARDHIAGLTVVLPDGQIVRLGSKKGENADRVATKLAASVGQLLAQRKEVIQEHSPRGEVFGSGYALERALSTDGQVDLCQLLVGSEGTLGLITELRLKTPPLPAAVGAVLLTFNSLERAAQAVQVLAPLGVASCDLMDRRHISLARETDPRYEVLLSGAAEAVLHVEVFGEDEQEAAGQIAAIVEAMRSEESLAAGALIAETADDLQLFSQLSKRFVSTLHRLKGKRRAVPGIEDLAVPRAALPQFFRRLQETLKRRQVTASVFGHAVQGQLHIRPLLDISSPADLRKLETLASDLYDTVWLLGGTMGGEHGDGLSRTPFASRQHGPLVNVFREVKRIFDPQGVLNPGKIVPSPGTRMTHHTRLVVPAVRPPATEEPAAETEPPPLVELQLDWDADEVTLATRACNGCGVCREQDDAVRMCPIFRFTPREEASPRAKANLVRGVLTGQLPEDMLLHDDAKQVADLCVNCHQCRLDCPAEVDIPKLMLEAKAAYVKTNGLRWDAWWLSRIDLLAMGLSLSPRLSNWMLRNGVVRWLLERSIGLSAGRKLPPIARRPYLKRDATRRLNRKPAKGTSATKGGRILYFVDTFANYYDTEVAEAFERIARRHDIHLYVPTRQLQSGMALIGQGALDAARRIAAWNVGLLAEAVRQGDTIVATEPSAVLALTHEYLHLLPDDEDAALVAENTFEACHYLWRRHLDSQLQLDLDPLPYKIAYHVPCHVRALGVGTPAESLMRLIPELDPVRLDKGCSGMAGTYGLLRRNYRSSLRAGLPMLSELRTGSYDLGVSECGACRTQMQQNAPMPTLHPLKLLAASYGLMPEVKKQLAGKGDGLQTPKG